MLLLIQNAIFSVFPWLLRHLRIASDCASHFSTLLGPHLLAFALSGREVFFVFSCHKWEQIVGQRGLRAQIVVLHGERYSKCEISRKCGVSKTAVHNAHFQLYGKYSDRKRSGQPRKPSKRVDNLMKRVVVRSPTTSIKKIRAQLSVKGTNVSHMIISSG